MDSKRFDMRLMEYDRRWFLSGKEKGSVDSDATENASVNASVKSIGNRKMEDQRIRMGQEEATLWEKGEAEYTFFASIER